MEFLDEEKIRSAISPHKRDKLSKVDIIASLDSTNSYLMQYAKTFQPGHVIVCEEQTKGRGRQGKNWVSPPRGNIYASLLWHFPNNITLNPLGLAIAVMIVEALEKLNLTEKLQLKWPNDIYVKGRKLGGILIESIPLTKNNSALVIGIGINVSPVSDLESNAISLREIKKEIASRNTIIGWILDKLFSGLKEYAANGFIKFHSRFQHYDMLPGKAVVVDTGKDTISGVVIEINELGELVLRDNQGKDHHFQTGEVSVVVG